MEMEMKMSSYILIFRDSEARGGEGEARAYQIAFLELLRVSVRGEKVAESRSLVDARVAALDSR